MDDVFVRKLHPAQAARNWHAKRCPVCKRGKGWCKVGLALQHAWIEAYNALPERKGKPTVADD